MESERQDAAMSGDANDPVPAEDTMRAIVQDAYGSPDVFRLRRSARLRSGTIRSWYAFGRLVWTGGRGI
jgi:hypothetical protein